MVIVYQGLGWSMLVSESTSYQNGVLINCSRYFTFHTLTMMLLKFPMICQLIEKFKLKKKCQNINNHFLNFLTAGAVLLLCEIDVGQQHNII